MRISTTILLIFVASICFAEEQTPAEKSIAKAIAGLEADRDKMTDTIEQAKIDKAIRELESLISDDHEPDASSPASDKLIAALRKKLSGKVAWKEKTGELTLGYDFVGKPQLNDFEVGSKRIITQRRLMALEAGDDLKHIARWKTFQVAATMSFKAMNGPGLASSTGAAFWTGGTGQDAIYVVGVGGAPVGKVVDGKIRRGTIPVFFKVTPEKVSVQYVKEVLAAPQNRPNDIHQVVLRGGNDGCAFSQLVISGVPDPAWLKEMGAVD